MATQVIQGLTHSSDSNWSSLFAKYYRLTRTDIYPDEIPFWRGVCANKGRVLEIGSGSGFIAKELFNVGIEHLTLIEPEKENAHQLHQLIKSSEYTPTTTITIIEDVVQNHRAREKYDVIFTSWDNLSMFPDFAIREQIFSHVSGLLAPGGEFVFHVSSESFHESDYHRAQIPLYFSIDQGDGTALEARFSIERHAPRSFTKTLEIKPFREAEWQTFLLPTVTITPSEIESLAARSGLLISSHTNTFSGKTLAKPDDHIWILRKPTA